jgi:glycosyltransferase involved in cell wall biosynthesis
VSVAMIVGGNTVIETLLWCLRSLYHMADEFVLADCGMPDSQLQIAINLLDNSEPHARWPEKIRVVPGINPREAGFERARNMSLEQCTMDWVFWVDTDERLLDQANLHKYLRNNRFTGYGVRQHHLAIDAPLKPDMPIRLFRREREDEQGRRMQFFGALHEHPEFALNEGPGDVIVLSDAHLAHIGYLTESIRQNRFTRNYPLLKMDEERYPERLLQKFFLMRDKVQIARFHLQQTNGRVDEQTRALMREVVQLGQKYFVGKASYMNSDAIAYYSEALEILGEGFSTSFSVDASLDKAKANGQTTYRFANKEDFLAEFNRRLDEKVDPLLGEYY